MKQYGWTPQTYDLLATRTLADGEHVREQWCYAFEESAFRAAFDLQSFARACKGFFANAVAPDIGLNDFAEVYARGDQRRSEQICAQLNDEGLDFAFEASEIERDYSATGLALHSTQHWTMIFIGLQLKTWIQPSFCDCVDCQLVVYCCIHRVQATFVGTSRDSTKPGPIW